MGNPKGTPWMFTPPQPLPIKGGQFKHRSWHEWRLSLPAMTALRAPLAAGGGDVDPFRLQFMVFVIAIFVGYFVVWA